MENNNKETNNDSKERLDEKITDFETSDEIKFAIMNKFDRIWNHKKYSFTEMLINTMSYLEEKHHLDPYKGKYPTNVEFTKLLDIYIEENGIK